MVWELHGNRPFQSFMEFANEVWRIFLRRRGMRSWSRLAQNGVTHVGFELMQVLVRNREADSVLAQLREHACQGQGGEALELVDVDEEFRRCASGISARVSAARPIAVTSGPLLAQSCA